MADLPGWMKKAAPGWAAFQKRHGLVADGLPGRGTLAKVLEIENDGEVVDIHNVFPPVETLKEFSYGGDPIRKGVSRDPGQLIPAFAVKVETLFQTLRAQGHDPLLWEAYRTPERAQKLSDKGTGIKKSMHCLGAAVDVVDADGLWTASPEFWDAIGEEAEALGLTVLYRNGRRRDRPHVQAIAVKDQSRFRRMTETERHEFVGYGHPGTNILGKKWPNV